MDKYLIIYHSEDNDGVFSATVYYDWLISVMHIDKESIQLMPATYNMLDQFENEYKDVRYLSDIYTYVIMLDISFDDASYMKELYDEFQDRFIWCDHHQSIITESKNVGFATSNGLRMIGQSTLLCTYEFLYKTKQFPRLFTILSAWDSFTYQQEGFSLDYVNDVNKGVTYMMSLDFNRIYSLVAELVVQYQHPIENKVGVHINEDMLIQNFENTGKRLNRYDDFRFESIVKDYGDFNWKLIDYDYEGRINNRNACAVFFEGPTSSLMFKSLTGQMTDNGIVFKHMKDSTWDVSLYNIYENDEFDCSRYLKHKYNGGGHPRAARCTLSEDQFIFVLKNKIL